MSPQMFSAEFLSANIGVVFAVIIAVVFLWFLLQFDHKVRPLRDKLSLARAEIKKRRTVDSTMTEENVNAITTFFKGNDYFEVPWGEFKGSLSKNKDNLMYNTLQAEKFFTRECVIESKIDIEFYSAVPGMLTGLGLIGTFLAIYFALNQLHMNSDQLCNVSQFINTLGGKFIASIAGLAAALIFLFVEKCALGEIDKSFKCLVMEINSAVEHKDTHLEKVAELLEKLADPEKSPLTKIEKEVGALSSRFSEDVATNIKDLAAMKSELVETRQNVVSLKSSIQEMRDQTGQILSVTRDFSDKQQEHVREMLTTIASDFHRMLMESANEEIHRLGLSINHITAATEELHGMISEVNSNFQGLLSAQREQLGDLLSYQNEQNEQLLEGHKQRFDEMTRIIQEHIASLMDISAQNLSTLNENAKSWSDEQQKTFIAMLELTQEQLKKESASMTEIISTAAQSYTTRQEQIQSKAEESLKSLLQQVQSSTDAGLVSTTEKVEKIADLTDKWTKSVATDLRSVLELSAQESRNLKSAGTELLPIIEAFKTSVDLNSKVLGGLSDAGNAISRAAQALSTNEIAMRKMSGEQLTAIKSFEAQINGYQQLLSTHQDLWRQQRESLQKLEESLAKVPVGKQETAGKAS